MAEVKIDELREKYPSNSIKTKNGPGLEKKEFTSKVTLEKDRVSTKIRKLFVPGDVKDVSSYLINNIIVPGFKNAVLGMIEIAFFGRTAGWRGGPSSSNTNYSYISSNGTRASNGPISPVVSNRDRISNNFSMLRFTGPNAYQEVEDVISTLLDYVDRYGQATVADFYNLCGVNPAQISSMDERWGWKGFRKLEPRAVRDGYVIDVSEPIQL